MKSSRFIHGLFLARILFIICCVCVVFKHYGRTDILRSARKADPPLITATYKGELYKVRQLLKDGADPNVSTFDGVRPIHLVCRNLSDSNGPSIFDALIDAGACVRVADAEGFTPLHVVPDTVVIKTRDQFYGDLIKMGGDMNAISNPIGVGTSVVNPKSNKRTYSVLDMLVENYDREGIGRCLSEWGAFVRREIVEKARNFAKDTGFRDIWADLDDYLSNFGGDTDRGTFMVRSIKDPKPSHELTPLMIAVINGDSIDNLIANKGMINTKSDDRFAQTALHIAIRHHKIPQIKQLLTGGADLQAVDWQKNTPLHCVAQLDSLGAQQTMTELLVAAGADINARNKLGNTMLLHSIHMHAPEFASYLVKTFGKKIDFRIKNKSGLDAYTLARTLKYAPLASLIAEHSR